MQDTDDSVVLEVSVIRDLEGRFPWSQLGLPQHKRKVPLLPIDRASIPVRRALRDLRLSHPELVLLDLHRFVPWPDPSQPRPLDPNSHHHHDSGAPLQFPSLPSTVLERVFWYLHPLDIVPLRSLSKSWLDVFNSTRFCYSHLVRYLEEFAPIAKEMVMDDPVWPDAVDRDFRPRLASVRNRSDIDVGALVALAVLDFKKLGSGYASGLIKEVGLNAVSLFLMARSYLKGFEDDPSEYVYIENRDDFHSLGPFTTPETRVAGDAMKLAIQQGFISAAAFGGMPLKWACLTDHPDLAGLVLDLLPEADLPVAENFYLDLAAARGHTAIVARILKHPFADPSADGNLALNIAAKNGRAAVVDMLLATGRVSPSLDAPVTLAIACTTDNPCAQPILDASIPDIHKALSGPSRRVLESAVHWSAFYGCAAAFRNVLAPFLVRAAAATTNPDTDLDTDPVHPAVALVSASTNPYRVTRDCEHSDFLDALLAANLLLPDPRLLDAASGSRADPAAIGKLLAHRFPKPAPHPAFDPNWRAVAPLAAALRFVGSKIEFNPRIKALLDAGASWDLVGDDKIVSAVCASGRDVQVLREMHPLLPWDREALRDLRDVGAADVLEDSGVPDWF
ncbi:hypothetical protein DFJ73DRAFT_924301 [Zopfochytrium polystomum]|nr:hypothetical protein DFJ73DRAFT_924301 [Zopfochytrium polystomum]